MKKNTVNFIEDLLRDYPNIQGYIARKKQDIKYPFNANRDENAGFGQGHVRNTAPAERILIKIEDSEFINAFLNQEAAIEDALMKCEPGFKKAIEKYYFNPYNREPFRKVGMDYGYANNNLYKQRNKLFKDIMKNLGMHHVIERDEYEKEKEIQLKLNNQHSSN